MDQLIFVYNADSGYFNMLADIAHKVFSPATYPCSLCDLTYGILKIRPEWEAFIKESKVPFVFLHKDEFHVQYPAFTQVSLPIVAAQTGAQLSILFDHLQLSQFKSVGELKQAVLARIE